MKHRICPYGELEAKGKIAVKLNNKPVVVVYSQTGEVYALRDVCPHKGPCLSDGMVDHNCSSNAAGEYVYEAASEVLRCPWHSWEFDIRTGHSLFDPEKVRVKTYETSIENGDVFVEI